MKNVTIIGVGRVGLPLALALEDTGKFNVFGLDIDENLKKSIAMKTMPFDEPGCQQLLSYSSLEIYTDIHELPYSDYYVITVGTPLEQHIETNLNYVMDVIDNLFRNVDMNKKTIVLRSTVSPRTTEFIVKKIRTNYKLEAGTDYFIAMCPERLIEGDALNELHILPQIIGTSDKDSAKRAEDLFSPLGVTIHHVSTIEAELSKLLTNIYRYINFAIPNYFSYITNDFGVDIFKLLEVMKDDYPRSNGLANPGFAAGTCLRKDFGMINENYPHTDILVQAYKINEFLPKHISNLLGDNIEGKTVGILGYTMKKDTDDTRDSLVPKMIRYINKQAPKEILISEPNLDILVSDAYNNYDFVNTRSGALVGVSDVIVIAMNHSWPAETLRLLEKAIQRGTKVIDVWNVLGRGLVIN